jgi:hypothetical protein
MKGTEKQEENELQQHGEGELKEQDQNSTQQTDEQQQQQGPRRRRINYVSPRRVQQQYPLGSPRPNPYPVYQGYAYHYEYMDHQQQEWGMAAGNPYW